MDFTTWLSLVTICTLGAMSPGPSIAIIIQITAKGGRIQGMVAALAHGIGIGCYALLAAAGLAVIIKQSPVLFESLKLLGAVFLVYLGIKALGVNMPNLHVPGFRRPESKEPTTETLHSTDQQKVTRSSNSFIIGFLTAFLNPKVALFFLALFSQFVSDQAGFMEKMLMASTAATIDALWYCLIALIASEKTLVKKFSGYGNLLQKMFGLLLIALAIRVALT